MMQSISKCKQKLNIGKKVRHRKCAGFTLAETLLAVLILLLVSVIVATGIPAAKNAYEKIVLGSNAQVLLSTTVEALRDELGTAWDVNADGTTITYYSGDTGNRSSISIKDSIITVQESIGELIIGKEDSDGIGFVAGNQYPLVSKAATTKDLLVTYTRASVDARGLVIIEGLEVRRKSNNVVLASVGSDGIKIQTFSALSDSNAGTNNGGTGQNTTPQG